MTGISVLKTNIKINDYDYDIDNDWSIDKLFLAAPVFCMDITNSFVFFIELRYRVSVDNPREKVYNFSAPENRQQSSTNTQPSVKFIAFL